MLKDNIDKYTRLMLRFQKGDECAYRSLVSSFKNRIYALAQRYFQKQRLAEKATLDVFQRVYARKNTFHADTTFSNWLFSVTYHIFCNYPMETNEEDKHNRRAPDKEEQRTVRRAMSKLFREERMALLLDHCEKMTIPEISEVLGNNPLAVETILCRARATLRVKLAAYLEPAGVA